MRRCAASVVAAATVFPQEASKECQKRHATGEFSVQKPSSRRRHTARTLPLHDSNRFGGRLAYMRMPSTKTKKYSGERWTFDERLLQYNTDMWVAQQTLRRQWKSRDWDVVELPFALAPQELRQVIPELHTEFPKSVDARNGKYGNVRDVVVPCEDLQDALFPRSEVKPYPTVFTPRDVPTRGATLDSFFGP